MHSKKSVTSRVGRLHICVPKRELLRWGELARREDLTLSQWVRRELRRLAADSSEQSSGR